MVTLAMLFNKVTGLYGLLAMLTGYTLSGVQWSMYLYSVATLAMTAYLFPHIRRQSPLQCLALAWLYALDTAVNTCYVVFFAVKWFLLHRLAATSGTGPAGSSPTASFSSAAVTVSQTARPSAFLPDPTATAVPIPVHNPIAGNATVTVSAPQVDGAASLALISLFAVARVYFCLVVAAYARAVLRTHLEARRAGWSGHSGGLADQADQDDEEDGEGEAGLIRRDPNNPFALGTPEGAGWRGKLGRAMIRVGRGYWVGNEMADDDQWARSVGSKFAARRRLQQQKHQHGHSRSAASSSSSGVRGSSTRRPAPDVGKDEAERP